MMCRRWRGKYAMCDRMEDKSEALVIIGDMKRNGPTLGYILVRKKLMVVQNA
jgi:hypothetical protein